MLPNHKSNGQQSLSATGAGEFPPTTRVLRQFRIVFNAVKTHFRNVEKAAGIGGAQLWALSVVQQQPGIGVGELARALDVHQTTASNLVKNLAAHGLIAMDRSGPDRRTASMTLLPAGQVRLAHAPMPFAGVLPDALSTLDSQTLARLEHDLGILITALQAGTTGENTPLSDL
ncbi:MarR family winged helix-turn-helix transcriptional regulator [Duganella sp. CT11-25]|uniref:MarR family winged helix-turn-helix transcriptional regulator n=1 Tax=unclassified Duganella TaxID=2636909 RepID=UPI0039AFBB3F